MATPGAKDGDVLEIDLRKLKVREIEEIEEQLGVGFDVAFSGERPKGRALRVCAWVFQKRDHPDVTLEEMGDFVIKVKDPDEADPTSAPGS